MKIVKGFLFDRADQDDQELLRFILEARDRCDPFIDEQGREVFEQVIRFGVLHPFDLLAKVKIACTRAIGDIETRPNYGGIATGETQYRNECRTLLNGTLSVIDKLQDKFIERSVSLGAEGGVG